MITNYLQRSGLWLARFAQIQLFICAISLPIITSWGLPISLLTLVGNLIFAPILSLFLLLSAIIFFFELCTLPNQWLLYALEIITSWWLWITSCASSWWLWYFPQPPIWWSILVPLLAALTLHYQKICTLYKNIGALSLLILCSLSYLKFVQKPDYIHQIIPCNKGELTILHDKQGTILIDPGYLGQRLSAPSWVEYILLPTLVKLVGSCEIKHLILLQLNKLSFDAINKLLSLTKVEKIYMPLWEGKFPYPIYKSYCAMRDKAYEKDCKIIRLTTKELFIPHEPATITLHPLDKSIKVSQVSYPGFEVIAEDAQSTCILALPAKLKK